MAGWLATCNISKNDCMFQQMLDVCGTSLVLPNWLILGVTVGTCDVRILEIRHYNITPVFLGRPTYFGPLT